MDQIEMQLISHFRILLRKETGEKIDLVKFTNDINYAKAILKSAIESKNQELVTIASQLLNSRGISIEATTVSQTETPKKPGADETDNTDDKSGPGGKDKYVGRLR